MNERLNFDIIIKEGLVERLVQAETQAQAKELGIWSKEPDILKSAVKSVSYVTTDTDRILSLLHQFKNKEVNGIHV